MRQCLFVALIIIGAVTSAIATESCKDLLSSDSSSTRTYLDLLIGKSRPRSFEANAELTKSTIFVALGLDSPTAPLQKFAQNMETQLQRRVVTYREFEDAHYISQTGTWWHRPPEQATAIVEQAIRCAVDLHPNSRVVIFNLDGFDPERLFGTDRQNVFSFTNFEIHLLLRERNLFLATRWYIKGRELTLEEAENFWKPIISRF